MRDQILHYLRQLLVIPSPSGGAEAALFYIFTILHDELGYPASCLLVDDVEHPTFLQLRVKGQNPQGPVLAWASHMDTLGVKVLTMFPHQTLQLPYPGYRMPGTFCRVSLVGGVDPQSVLNQEVLFLTETGAECTGTLLQHSRGVHVGMQGPSLYSYLDPLEKDDTKKKVALLCRLDQDTPVEAGTLGSIPTYLNELPNGLLKSRYLDSKADVAVMLAVLADWKLRGYTPPHTVDFMFNMREEIGWPMVFDPDVTHCVALEFIPSELGCALNHVGLVASDGCGPTDGGLNESLAAACKPWQGQVGRYDIPQFYSDSSLPKVYGAPATYHHTTLGFGMDQSHGNERAHMDALVTMAKVVNSFTLAP